MVPPATAPGSTTSPTSTKQNNHDHRHPSLQLGGGGENSDEEETPDFLDFSQELNTLTKYWNIVLGVSAVLDFLAATVDSQARKFIRIDTTKYLDPWLHQHSFELGMLFSVLWFFDAFITATQTRNKSLQQAAKARVMRPDGWQATVQKAERDALIRYVQSMTLQLLLLPVGFYIWLSPGESITIVSQDADDETSTIFTSSANVSLLHAVSHFTLRSLSHLLKTNFVREARKRILRLIGYHIRHPVRTIRTVQKITRWLRWLRIVGPIVGTTNKLLGNVVELGKTMRQRRAAARAAEIRRILWNEMTLEESRNYAATLIQKTYRARLSRRQFRALQLMRGDAMRIAALKLQRNFRAASARAKARVERKKRELEMLQKKKKKAPSEKIRMYKLQEDLAKEAEEFINQALLRPNTTFSVAWRTTFVIAVVLELSVLIAVAVNPSFHQGSLFPTPISELPECTASDDGRFRRILSAFSKKEPREVPRYCADDMVALQAFGISVLTILVDTISFLVPLVFFVDVFVCFFTGEYSRNGVLQPKPFFARWIAPGVMLQLCVNPHMDTVAEVLANAFWKIWSLGPVRVFRWTVAIFFPFLLVTTRWTSKAWSSFVARQNSSYVHGSAITAPS